MLCVYITTLLHYIFTIQLESISYTFKVIPYAIEIYGFISYIVPFFGTSGVGKIKKNFLGSHHHALAVGRISPRNPLSLNKLRAYFVHINLVTT